MREHARIMRMVAEDEIRILRNIGRGDPPNPTDQDTVPLTGAATANEDIQNAHFFTPDGRGFTTRSAYRHYMRRHFREEWGIVRGNYRVQDEEPEAELPARNVPSSSSSDATGNEDVGRDYPARESVTPDQVINRDLTPEEEDGDVDSSRPWIGLEGNSDVDPSPQQQGSAPAIINTSTATSSTTPHDEVLAANWREMVSQLQPPEGTTFLPTSTSSSSEAMPIGRQIFLEARRQEVASMVQRDVISFPAVSFVPSNLEIALAGSGSFIYSENYLEERRAEFESRNRAVTNRIAQEAKAKAKAKAAPPREFRRGSSSEDEDNSS